MLSVHFKLYDSRDIVSVDSGDNDKIETDFLKMTEAENKFEDFLKVVKNDLTLPKNIGEIINVWALN